MKIALCFFCYAKDAALLDCALRAVPHLRAAGDVVDVYVCDDVAAPLAEVPAGVYYRQTSFPRRGNLNGGECIAGMVKEYARIVAEGGYDWVVKVDCDTVVNDLEWLRGIDPGKVLQVGTSHEVAFNSGSCYAVSRLGAARMLAGLKTSVKKRLDVAWQEDKAMFRYASLLGNVVRHVNDKNEPLAGLLYNDWFAREKISLRALVVPCAVAFKRCMWHVNKEQYDADRAEALARMSQYVDFLATL